MVRNNTCKCMPKNAYGLVYARLFNCAAASLPWRLLQTYLESCANIVLAVVYCPPYRPPSCRQSVARRVRSWNPSKSTLAHDVVATAVLHKHHPINRVGAGLIQFVYRLHLRLATEATRNRKAFSPFFVRVLFHRLKKRVLRRRSVEDFTKLPSGSQICANVCVMYVMTYVVCAGRTDR